MKKTILYLMLIFTLQSQAQLNIVPIDTIGFPEDTIAVGEGLWGYVDEFGNEYAITTAEGRFSVIDITTPGHAVVKLLAPAAPYQHEVQVYHNYAYITSEMDALIILNLSDLPAALDTGDYHRCYGDSLIGTSHSLYIDTVAGRLYLNGGTGWGVRTYDLTTDPAHPFFLGAWSDMYVHDCFARGDTIYTANIDDGVFSVLDASNPASINLLAQEFTPKHFTHNCWLSGNGNYLFTTDEIDSAWIAAYDISDLGNIQEVDRIRNSDTSGSIPHNTYWWNDYLITGYYADGVTIHDVSDPTNMVLVGRFDPTPGTGPGFGGTWGAYFNFPSGKMIIPNRYERLYVLQPNFVRAGYLKGHITDAVTGAPVNNVNIKILGTIEGDHSDFTGYYSSGEAIAGTYQVAFSRLSYISDTFTVTLTNGVTTVLDVALQPISSIHLTGQVKSAVTGLPIAGAQVQFQNESYFYHMSTNGLGFYDIPVFYLDTVHSAFDISISKWGYINYCDSNVNMNDISNPWVVELDEGYYDDFNLDLGWLVDSSCIRGAWTRSRPRGCISWEYTFRPPNIDSPFDCLDYAYVTGNKDSLSNLDVGTTTLYSPFFEVSGYSDPYLNVDLMVRLLSIYDSIQVVLQDDDSSYVLDNFKVDTSYISLTWAPYHYRILDYTDHTGPMRLVIIATDGGSNSMVKAGIDHFGISEGISGIKPVSIINDGLHVFPNPTVSQITVSSETTFKSVQIIDMTGKIVMNKNVNDKVCILDLSVLEYGIYSIRTVDLNGKVASARIVKQ